MPREALAPLRCGLLAAATFAALLAPAVPGSASTDVLALPASASTTAPPSPTPPAAASVPGVAVPSVAIGVAPDTVPVELDGIEGVREAVEAGRRIDAAGMLRTQEALAHDSMEGRRAGSEGGERARRLLVERFEELGLAPAFEDGHLQPFSFEGPDGELVEAANVVGYVEGREHPHRYLVVTAHYDHLGSRDGAIYNGADDNASGTAAILALAEHFLDEPPTHTLVFAAMDAEEMGLRGAREFVADPPIPREGILLNVNLDMVSRSEAGELYAAGTYHYPFLVHFLQQVAQAAPVTLLLGYDSPDDEEDWTMASDHGAFHEEGIPFIYFGVEDHPGYHQPTDVFEDVTHEFYVNAVETVLDFVLLMDRALPHYLP